MKYLPSSLSFSFPFPWFLRYLCSLTQKKTWRLVSQAFESIAVYTLDHLPGSQWGAAGVPSRDFPWILWFLCFFWGGSMGYSWSFFFFGLPGFSGGFIWIFQLFNRYLDPPTGGFWKLAQKPPETTCWGVQVYDIYLPGLTGWCHA